MLRDFNAAAKHQLEQKIAASEAAVQHLTSIRQDLDQAYACIKCVLLMPGCTLSVALWISNGWHT